MSKGQCLFYIGIFLMPSALFFGGLFLFISLLISLFINRKFYFRDKWNIPLLISSLLLFISCLYNQIFLNNEINYWIGLLNWIPLFIAFFAFQFYVDTSKKRYYSSLFLLMGSFPVFFSFITQYWFNWYGPYEALDGLIVWFQKPLILSEENPVHIKGASGLFSNSNYAGLWLSMIFPFSIIFIFKKHNGFLKKIIALAISFLIIILTVITESRNAFLGITISIPIIFAFKGMLLISISLLILYFINAFSLLSLLPNNLNQVLSNFLPERLLQKFQIIFINNIRIEIWKETFLKIINKPLFGWGAGSFPFILVTISGINNITHAHNMPLELAYNYGFPLSLILCGTVFLIIYKSGKIIYRSNYGNFENLIDRAWLASSSIVLFAHMSDLTYYDGRVSLCIWIFLAGLKSIIDKEKIIK